MEKVTVVTRSFQRGTSLNGEGKESFNHELFEGRVAGPISHLLGSDESDSPVERIIVVVNGEKGSPLAEKTGQQTRLSPTIKALRDRFPDEVASKRLIPFLCTDWGPNPGSATALSEGARIAHLWKAGWVLNWSPEIEMGGCRIAKALCFAEKHCLDVVGFLRESWWERPQWKVPQNTAALWRLKVLEAVGFFSRRCNGTGETIMVEGFGETPLAGMEDFHALLSALRDFPDKLRWGMVERACPLRWNTEFEDPRRQFEHDRKVARQYEVMKAWTQEVFPGVGFKEIMNMIFARCHLD